MKLVSPTIADGYVICLSPKVICDLSGAAGIRPFVLTPLKACKECEKCIKSDHLRHFCTWIIPWTVFKWSLICFKVGNTWQEQNVICTITGRLVVISHWNQQNLDIKQLALNILGQLGRSNFSHCHLVFSEIQPELTNLPILPNFCQIRLICLFCLILTKFKIP